MNCTTMRQLSFCAFYKYIYSSSVQKIIAYFKHSIAIRPLVSNYSCICNIQIPMSAQLFVDPDPLQKQAIMLRILFGLALAGAVSGDDAQVEYPYCFRFTWIGPYQDKKHIGGLTCEHLREDFKNVPCRRPLVATDNDAIPDTVDLWRHHYKQPNAFGCPMVPGETCVKYTYTYNKGVQNITYMCAKVNATSGCYRQKYISGLEVEVCVCDSQLGHMPCNRAACSFRNLLKNVILLLLLGGLSHIWL